jgi:hypothetical protein
MEGRHQVGQPASKARQQHSKSGSKQPIQQLHIVQSMCVFCRAVVKQQYTANSHAAFIQTRFKPINQQWHKQCMGNSTTAST